MLAIRNVECDYYLTEPIAAYHNRSDLRNSGKIKVPVIRIFGGISTGEKCCLHVHGVFPYLCVPSPEEVPSADFLSAFADNLDASITTLLNKKRKQRKEEDGTGALQKQAHVHGILPVSAIPFYGFHDKPRVFLKLYFYNPGIVKCAASLLREGVVLQTEFQPYELHLPYKLQFFEDFDIYGMEMVSVKKVQFRRGKSPRLRRQSQFISFPESDLEPISCCQVEADCSAADICRNSAPTAAEVKSLKNPGLRFIWEDEAKRRRARGIQEPLAVPSSQERQPVGWSESEKYFQDLLSQVLPDLENADKNAPLNPTRTTSSSQSITH